MKRDAGTWMALIALVLLVIFVLIAAITQETSAAEAPEMTYAELVAENMAMLNKQSSEMEQADPFVEISIDNDVATLVAKTIYGEANGLSKLQKSGVAWCIVNRYIAGYGTWQQIVINGFYGYRYSNPVTTEDLAIAKDVLARYELERSGMTCGSVGRTLPADYLWFRGAGVKVGNIFRNAYSGGTTWDWSLPSPY